MRQHRDIGWVLVAASCVLVTLQSTQSAESPAATWGGDGVEYAFLGRTTGGSTYSLGLTTSFGTQGISALLLKVSPTGDVDWSRVWSWSGGSSDFEGSHVAPNGDLYITGCTGFSFDSEVCTGDILVLKYDSSGVFQWAKTWSSGDPMAIEDSDAVIVDASGNVYVAGSLTNAGVTRALLLKLSTDGSFLWGRSWGRGRVDSINAMGVDDAGNVYLAGNTVDASFIPAALLLKYSPSGDLEWARSWQNGAIDNFSNDALGLFVTPAGDVFVTGADDSQAGRERQFIARLDSEGNPVGSLLWQHSGSLDADGGAIALDGAGNAYVGGSLEDPLGFEPDRGLLLVLAPTGELLKSLEWIDPTGAFFATFLPVGDGALYVSGATGQPTGFFRNVAGIVLPGVDSVQTFTDAAISVTGSLTDAAGTESTPVSCAEPPCGVVDVMWQHLTRLCLQVEPELELSKGLCPGGVAAGPYDVIRGDLEALSIGFGMVDLGGVHCVADTMARDRVSDVSVVPAPDDGMFYLAKHSAEIDFGEATGGERRQDWVEVDPCP